MENVSHLTSLLSPHAKYYSEPQADYGNLYGQDAEDFTQLSNGDTSPSRISVHSTSSNTNINIITATVPQLKRKTRNKHMRPHLHSTQSTSSTPALDADTPLIRLIHQHALPSNTSRPHLTRSNTAPSPPKRPPASHSSYGIQTTAGPPPSFDTRRTLSQERIWRLDRAKSLRMTLGAEHLRSQQYTAVAEPEASSNIKQSSPSISLPAHPSPDTADTHSVATPTNGDGVAMMEEPSEQGLRVSHSEHGSKASSESHKSEDLFLNIAKVDATRPSSSRGEKKRSRISLPFYSAGRPATSHGPEAVPFQNDASVATPRAELSPYHSKRSSLQFGQLRGMRQSSQQDLTDDPSSDTYNLASSTLYADTPRPVQRVPTAHRSNRFVSESGLTLDKPKTGEQTESSTVSTTAPSTVWDELDDLKSRIRKLELTGKLPPSSAAAMSTADRPRTATTAATTMSTSPKHNKDTKVTTQLQSTIEGIPSTVHPLMHEALGNAKAVVSHDIYQKLQATASDALQLASLTTFDGGSVRNSAAAATERQTRRRVESLCRSLTELTIALSSEHTHRPGSRDHHISPNIAPRSRRYSQTNDSMPPVTTRVQSRLETRRVSHQLGHNNARHVSPDVDSPTALPQQSGSATRTTRISGALRSRRTHAYLDGANDEEEASPSARPVSRAMTEIAARRTSRDHVARSREYTSIHPMPSKTDLVSTTTTPLPTFISRRKYPTTASAEASSPAESPLATRQSWGRISIVHQDNASTSGTASEVPQSTRSRRSLGFASRLGSSVGSRLRAAKSERVDSRSYKEPPVSGSDENTSIHNMPREQ